MSNRLKASPGPESDKKPTQPRPSSALARKGSTPNSKTSKAPLNEFSIAAVDDMLRGFVPSPVMKTTGQHLKTPFKSFGAQSSCLCKPRSGSTQTVVVPDPQLDSIYHKVLGQAYPAPKPFLLQPGASSSLQQRDSVQRDSVHHRCKSPQHHTSERNTPSPNPVEKPNYPVSAVKLEIPSKRLLQSPVAKGGGAMSIKEIKNKGLEVYLKNLEDTTSTVRDLCRAMQNNLRGMCERHQNNRQSVWLDLAQEDQVNPAEWLEKLEAEMSDALKEYENLSDIAKGAIIRQQNILTDFDETNNRQDEVDKLLADNSKLLKETSLLREELFEARNEGKHLRKRISDLEDDNKNLKEQVTKSRKLADEYRVMTEADQTAQTKLVEQVINKDYAPKLAQLKKENSEAMKTIEHLTKELHRINELPSHILEFSIKLLSDVSATPDVLNHIINTKCPKGWSPLFKGIPEFMTKALTKARVDLMNEQNLRKSALREAQYFCEIINELLGLSIHKNTTQTTASSKISDFIRDKLIEYSAQFKAVSAVSPTSKGVDDDELAFAPKKKSVISEILAGISNKNRNLSMDFSEIRKSVRGTSESGEDGNFSRGNRHSYAAPQIQKLLDELEIPCQNEELMQMISLQSQTLESMLLKKFAVIQ